MQIDSGQRFDILLQTKSQQELRRSNKTSFSIQFETRARPKTVVSYAVLAYGRPDTTLPSTPPLSLPQDVANWLEYSLEPLVPNNFPSAAEVTRTVHLKSMHIDKGATWSINDASWREADASSPYLVSIYENGQAAIPSYDEAIKNGGHDPVLNAYPARIGEVLEIIFENEPYPSDGSFDVHPWHAHGGHFYDIGSGTGLYNATANEEKLKGYNPVMRDTTMLYKGLPGANLTGAGPPSQYQSWRGWRLRVENAGVWMIHCHTIQHMVMGKSF